MIEKNIIGFDPGYLTSGFGVIKVNSQCKITYITSGCLSLKDHQYKLKFCYDELTKLCITYQPSILVCEQVFMASNVQTCLKLGKVIGTFELVSQIQEIPFYSYPTSVIKKVVAGIGTAPKLMVAEKVIEALNLPGDYLCLRKLDEFDALASCLCLLKNLNPFDLDS